MNAAALRTKSQALTSYFIELVETLRGGLLISPRDPNARDPVSFTHGEAAMPSSTR